MIPIVRDLRREKKKKNTIENIISKYVFSIESNFLVAFSFPSLFQIYPSFYLRNESSIIDTS